MVSPVEKLKKMIIILGATAAVYGGFRYLLPLVVPFLCAYAAALWIRPSIRYLEYRMRRRLPVTLIGSIELIMIGLILIGVGYVAGSRIISQLERLLTSIPEGLIWLDERLTGICRQLEVRMGFRSDYLVAAVREMIRELGTIFKQSTMPALMTNSVWIVVKALELLVFLVLFFVSALMFLQEMDEIRERKDHSIFHREFLLIGKRTLSVCGAWIKAEIIMFLITSVLCTLGLFWIGNSYAFLFGIGIGVLDALPLFGAGVILIPWGFICLLQKHWMEGIVLWILFAACYLIRQGLEAKLMGSQVGLSPLETLIAMYVGLQLFGIAGFLLGPVGVLLVKDLVELYWYQGGEDSGKT